MNMSREREGATGREGHSAGTDDRPARGNEEIEMIYNNNDTAACIEVTVPSGTPSRDWLRVAQVRARRACEVAGVDFRAAEVVVMLPEAGRYMTKAPGFISMVAVG